MIHPNDMTEDRGPDSLQAAVLGLMDDYGLWGHHESDSRRSGKGWPDWVILGPRGGLFRELKAERGIVSEAQREVGSRLAEAGFDWAIWRPMDLLDGTIGRQLAAVAAPREKINP